MTRPHSVHSFKAISIFFSLAGVISKTFISGAESLISTNAVTEFATTIGLGSPMSSCSVSRKPFSTHMVGFRSKSFATQRTAVFRT